MKSKDQKIQDFINRCKTENNGHYPQIVGDNGSRTDLTIDNYENLQIILEEKLKTGEIDPNALIG